MLWLKVGTMCPWRKGGCLRGMVQDDTDFCWCPVAVPTTMGGTLVLRLPQGESVVMYMPLDPASAIAVSLGLMLVKRLHLGVVEASAT